MEFWHAVFSQSNSYYKLRLVYSFNQLRYILVWFLNFWKVKGAVSKPFFCVKVLWSCVITKIIQHVSVLEINCSCCLECVHVINLLYDQNMISYHIVWTLKTKYFCYLKLTSVINIFVIAIWSFSRQFSYCKCCIVCQLCKSDMKGLVPLNCYS